MIIQHSSIGLESNQQNHTNLQVVQKQQRLSQATTGNQSEPAMQRWALETQVGYQYENRSRNKFISHSEVSQGGQLPTIKHSMIAASQKLTARELLADEAHIAIRQAFPSQKQSLADSVSATGLASFRFEQHIHYQQASHNVMSAQGKVSLSDGREINFNLHLEHQQTTRIEAMTSLSLQKVAMHDPLVINLGDQPVRLQDTHFEFDLLGEGKTQTYAMLGGGAGYLTFDVNGDGKVTDGRELFGTQTGDAYGELTHYDDDGNGWIDENDAIFSQLKIWHNQADNQATISLAQAGAGAIYLGNTPFEYQMRDSNGALQGQSKQAGLVLMENGELKTSQAIDLMPIIKADSLQMIEQDPAFKQLQKMAEAFNSWQQVQTMNQQATTPLSPGLVNNQSAPKNWFEELQERIEKLVEERRVFMERIFGKSEKTPLARA